MSGQAELEHLDADLAHLGSLWEGPLGHAYAAYRSLGSPKVALAAALVETGIDLHGLGRHVASPGDLLMGDLCFARASRLLAEEASRQVQVGVAKAIEHAAAGAAAGDGSHQVRRMLAAVLEGEAS
jgi:hypothetical protein